MTQLNTSVLNQDWTNKQNKNKRQKFNTHAIVSSPKSSTRRPEKITMTHSNNDASNNLKIKTLCCVENSYRNQWRLTHPVVRWVVEWCWTRSWSRHNSERRKERTKVCSTVESQHVSQSVVVDLLSVSTNGWSPGNSGAVLTWNENVCHYIAKSSKKIVASVNKNSDERPILSLNLRGKFKG